MAETEKQLRQLREFLATRFSRDELQMLCFDLGLDDEDLPSGPKSSLLISLIWRLAREDRLLELIDVGRKQRPEIRWDRVAELIESIPWSKLQLKDGELTERSEPPALSHRTFKPWLRYYLRPRSNPIWVGSMLAGLVSLVASVFTILQFYGISVHTPALLPPTPLPRMNGDLKVAVAKFGELNDQGDLVEAQADLANLIYQTLKEQLEDLNASANIPIEKYFIGVQAPSQTRLIIGATMEERARSAEKLAGEIGADVVIYAYLQKQDDIINLTPGMYLSSTKFEDAEELIGEYELSALQIQSLDDVEELRQLRAQLVLRVQSLVEFILGLSLYKNGNAVKALTHLQKAEANWDEGIDRRSSGKEILYLFLGNTHNKLHNLDAAESYYRRSLAVKPDYARAKIGLAEVLFHKARGEDCTAGKANVAELWTALNGYQAVLAAQDQPTKAYIPTKAAFGLGRVYLCLSSAGAGNLWEDANREFGVVITDFQRSNEDLLRERAANAYAYRGLVYWLRPKSDDIASIEDYRQAVQEYQEAINLLSNRSYRSDYTEQRALFYQMQAQLYEGLYEYERADKAWDEAIRLDVRRPSPYQQVRDSLYGQRMEVPPTKAPR